jgi:hypothetical protein
VLQGIAYDPVLESTDRNCSGNLAACDGVHRDGVKTAGGADRCLLDEAIRWIETDVNCSANTHLNGFQPSKEWRIGLYLKDESTHPTGSLERGLV